MCVSTQNPQNKENTFVFCLKKDCIIADWKWLRLFQGFTTDVCEKKEGFVPAVAVHFRNMQNENISTKTVCDE